MRLLFVAAAISAALATVLLAWDSKIHTGIVHASLMAIPSEDRIRERWGDEVWRLREYVQMGDWINTLVSQREAWDTGGQTLEQQGIQFFANDYLLFPAMPHAVQHMVPAVKATYRPFFLRALQALRTESPASAARWTGSLLHFVTDSGSPPHTIGITGTAHTHMESWLDPSVIDLTNYHAQSLGADDEAAVNGLLSRVDGLIAFSAIRAREMMPFVKVDDRAHMEPLAVESAAETARVTADVIHTLLQLTAKPAAPDTGSLMATISAPALDGMENLPAKLVLLGTDYSTLSQQALPAFHTYRGAFSLRNLPPGVYRAAIERVGSRTLFLPTIELKPGQTVHADWRLEAAAVPGNLAPNPDLTLRWLTPDAPDHWRYDAPRRQWISDNIPVTPGHGYRAGYTPAAGAEPSVGLEWMAHAWEAMKMPPVAFEGRELSVTAPAGAIFVRFVVRGQTEPSVAVKGVSISSR